MLRRIARFRRACSHDAGFWTVITGNFNLGRYSNKEVDALIAQIRVETDEKKRDAAITQALKLLKEDYGYLPLHHQIRPWAMRKGVETVYRPDDRPVPWWTSVK